MGAWVYRRPFFRHRRRVIAPTRPPDVGPAVAQPRRARRALKAHARARRHALPPHPQPAAPGFATALSQLMRFRRQQARARRWRPRPWLNLEPFVPPVFRARGYRKGANALAGSNAGDNAVPGSERGG